MRTDKFKKKKDTGLQEFQKSPKELQLQPV